MTADDSTYNYMSCILNSVFLVSKYICFLFSISAIWIQTSYLCKNLAIKWGRIARSRVHYGVMRKKYIKPQCTEKMYSPIPRKMTKSPGWKMQIYYIFIRSWKYHDEIHRMDKQIKAFFLYFKREYFNSMVFYTMFVFLIICVHVINTFCLNETERLGELAENCEGWLYFYDHSRVNLKVIENVHVQPSFSARLFIHLPVYKEVSNSTHPINKQQSM